MPHEIGTLSALLVDDDQMIIQELVTAIDVTDLFMRVDHADNLGQASLKLKAHGYELIILNHKLKDGVGLHLLKEKISPKSVIYTFSSLSDEEIKAAKALGINNFLPKPYIIENVVELIISLVGPNYRK